MNEAALPGAIPETAKEKLGRAVHRSPAFTREGMLERLFTFAFRRLVYPQIWEDPEVDMAALRLGPDSRIVTIASGGCNALSYLRAGPKEIVAVDLNPAHVALARLKRAALEHLPDYESFYRFVGAADQKSNLDLYARFLRERIDEDTRRYWEGRDWDGRKRITLFSRRIHRHGLFGHFIGFGHLVARAYGVNPEKLVQAKSLDEQRAIFAAGLGPLFDRPFVRWATSKKVALYGLGIPPAQYASLAGGNGRQMADVLRERLERLATAFPLSENYFAWQAFARRYAEGGPLPPYLEKKSYEAVRAAADRLKVVHRSFTEHLSGEAAGSLDGYVLLDAQDWMDDQRLNELWAETTRTARIGARVIFRTADQPTILPGRVDTSILGRWRYEEEESRAHNLADRSATYGGFHLYVFEG